MTYQQILDMQAEQVQLERQLEISERHMRAIGLDHPDPQWAEDYDHALDLAVYCKVRLDDVRAILAEFGEE